MGDLLPESLFVNPVWHSLHGPHRHLACSDGGACRYPADVAPFAAIDAPSAAAFAQLRSLLDPGESLWIADYGRTAPGLVVVDALDCVQMVLPEEVDIPGAGPGPGLGPGTGAGPGRDVLPLTAAHAPEMVALTNVAFPGFFRPATYRMGSFFGVRAGGELVAMGGERLLLPGHPEMSAICTHPDHRGEGLATDIIRHLARHHRRAGLVSWLHVGAPNRRAIDLYASLGFERVRNVMLHRITRSS